MPEPPLHIRRFVAAEWGWPGPRYEGGHLVLEHHAAHLRYLDAWHGWCLDNDVDLIDWFDRYGVRQ